MAVAGPAIASAPELYRVKLFALKLPRTANELPAFVSTTLSEELPLNVVAMNGALCVMAPLVVFRERLPLTSIVDPTLKVPVLIASPARGVDAPTAPEKVVAPEVLVLSEKPPSTVDAKPIAPPAVSLTVAAQVSVTALAND